MTTRSTVGYWTDMDSEGNPYKFIGTYVHHDGHNVGHFLRQRFGDDTQAIKRWVDEGITQRGYSSAEHGEPNAGEPFPITLEHLGMVEVCWLLDVSTGKLRKLSRKQIRKALEADVTSIGRV